MARKKTVAAEPPGELQDSLIIDGKNYNINAKKAVQVSHAFTVEQFDLDGNVDKDNTVTFNGYESKKIQIVPASGGKFDGPLRVGSVSNGNIEIVEDKETIVDDAVLNYADLKNTVFEKLLNNSVLYTWDGTEFSPGGEEASIQSISIVLGNNSDVGAFAAKNFENKKFSAYIYVADDGNIYFGTSESASVSGVRVSADKAYSAQQLENSRTFKVDLASTVTEKAFNGTADVTLGVNGILHVDKGGTGQDSLDKVTVQNAKQLVTSTGPFVTGDDVVENNYEIVKIIEGITKVKKAESADSATKALQDTDGKPIHLNYYRSPFNEQNTNTIRILKSSDYPGGLASVSGSNGDIIILY